ncbi:heme-binding protein [Sphingobium subterraneum]|uniref:Uncharacterized protein GlcG (DUF336 family) n=1 Tax=Sphingobium subterraneum TaxID=627688 RepID=A0A841IYV9_9SPHN|nr:heme-binding protein [Sphingobium subterraneum]MBB6124139.1 uncharacterized protein GlcG (DUF336 family) [Sphingobium subterraneum]
MRLRDRLAAPVAALALLLASCGGGGGSSSSPAPVTPTPAPTRSYSDPAQEALSISDVQAVVGHAVAEAQARSLPAVIAVTDRVGNVLAVYSMPGARATATTAAAPNGQNIDAQNLTVPAAAGAIAKAITGAYLSSSGNAFSTRTASYIVQEHYPPGPAYRGLPSGPLFGVQFSQLPCSDLNTRLNDPRYPGAANDFIGPKRSPLGLAADPGGFPLYKNGVMVGGVGVMADGVYGLDADSDTRDNDPEEAIGLAATRGFEADVSIRADRITAGVQLVYSDIDTAQLMTSSAAALDPSAFVAIPGYTAGPARAGVAYGAQGSGFRRATTGEFSNGDAFVLTDGNGANRFPIRAGTDAGDVPTPLTATEVTALLEEAFKIMTRARAQIRKPLDSRAQVTISVVDSRGAPLGIVRSPDAPIFGTDVSLQKARTAAFFSNTRAGSTLLADPSADVRSFVAAAQAFLGSTALTGQNALTDRAIGNLARPYYPDGQLNTANGPFSRPIAQFNPFSTGLQSALVLANLGAHLGFVVSGGAQADTPQSCTSSSRLANGIQIFPGSVPIYRGNTLIGAIGVSGDGVDQDDMISFLGAHYGGLRTTDVRNAPGAIRADTLTPQGVRLRYVQCPIAPFLDTTDQLNCTTF